MHASQPQQVTRPQPAGRRPSPILDLIGKHRFLLGAIYERHVKELAEKGMSRDVPVHHGR